MPVAEKRMVDISADIVRVYLKDVSRIPVMTPAEERSDVLDILHEDRFIDRAPQEVYAKHPERFKGTIPKPMVVPQEVWINKPSSKSGGGCYTKCSIKVSHFH